MRVKRWLGIFALMGLVAFPGASFSSEPGTGVWLLETCRGDHGTEGRAFCMGYTMGLADLMMGQQRICMTMDVTSEQIRMTVQDFLAQHPQQQQQHPVLLVIRALEAGFPCGASR
jgi:hypothetical protein